MQKMQILVRLFPGIGIKQFDLGLRDHFQLVSKLFQYNYEQVADQTYLYTFVAVDIDAIYPFLDQYFATSSIVFFSCHQSQLLYAEQILVYVQMGKYDNPLQITSQELYNGASFLAHQHGLMLKLFKADLPFVALSFQENKIPHYKYRHIVDSLRGLLDSFGGEILFHSKW
jgi:hypothetical protein